MYRRFLLIAFIACIACSCAYADDVKLTSIDVQAAVANPNLAPNGSFEQLGTNGFPDGWKWDKRNTNATCTVDNSSAFIGDRCLKCTINSTTESGVYAELLNSSPIKIEPNKPYTLSVWSKSDNPGYLRIGGGSDWHYNVTILASEGKWQRTSVTFTSKENDKDFEISIVSKGVSKCFWLDDIKLEAGNKATFDTLSKSIQLCPQNQDMEFVTDGDFSIPFDLYIPKATSGSIEATISTSKERCTKQMAFQQGIQQVTVNGHFTNVQNSPLPITLRLIDGDNEAVTARTNVTFYSETYAKNRLEGLKQQMPGFKTKLEQLKARGMDVSYPMVSYTVLDNFIGYAGDDAVKGELKRAFMQISDMEWIARRLNKDLSAALIGKTKFPAVPRWTGDTRPTVKSSSFIAPTVTPGKPGHEIRPVFFNGYGHFWQVQDDIEKWPNYGVNTIQFETGPTVIFPSEDKVNDITPNILKTLDRAEKAGVAVNFLLSPHYFPGWMFDKYPELRKHREYFFPMCLHAPECQEFLKRYVELVVAPLKDHPALQSICISNEPRNVEEPCKYATDEFHTWLKSKHGDIATLNNRWNTNYTSFDEIKLPNPFDADDRKPAQRWFDFVRWNQEFFADWHKMMADAVHAVAPNVTVNAKVQTFTLGSSEELKCGNDAYLYGKVTDLNGNDSGNMYSSTDEFAQSWLENDMYYDLQRSVKDAPVVNSENHIIPDRQTKYTPAEHIRTALWQQAIHGQSATTIWVWQRAFDKSSDFYGSIMHRPACARAVGITNYDLNRAAYEVTAIQQAPAQILILHDTSALVYDKESYESCLFRLYMAMNLSGVKVGFVTERQLEDGFIPETSVLCIPNAKHLTNAAFDTLRKYKGHVIFFGDEPLAYDEYDKQRMEKIAGDNVPFDKKHNTAKDLWDAILPKLAALNVQSPVKVADRSGKPVWGVEVREATTVNGTIINICNYLNTPVSLKLSNKNGNVSATDVLTGEKVSGVITLKPLDIRLLNVKR